MENIYRIIRESRLNVVIFPVIEHKRSQGGAEGAIAPPKMPKKYIFNKKSCAKFLFFCTETSSGGLQRPFRGEECPPPKKSAPSKTNTWLRLL